MQKYKIQENRHSQNSKNNTKMDPAPMRGPEGGFDHSVVFFAPLFEPVTVDFDMFLNSNNI